MAQRIERKPTSVLSGSVAELVGQPPVTHFVQNDRRNQNHEHQQQVSEVDASFANNEEEDGGKDCTNNEAVPAYSAEARRLARGFVVKRRSAGPTGGDVGHLLACANPLAREQ